MKIDKDDIICKYNSELEKHNNVPPIMLATDTYDMLRNVGYNENEALKLTEIICSNKINQENNNILCDIEDAIREISF